MSRQLTSGVLGRKKDKIDTDFILIVNTEIAGTSGSGQFALNDMYVPYTLEADGIIQEINTENHTINFTTAGINTIKIRNSNGWDSGIAGQIDKNKVIEIANFGDVEWISNMAYYFIDMVNMDVTADDFIKIDSNKNYLFYGCSSLVWSNKLKEVKVPTDLTSYFGWFIFCSNFNINISNWDYSNINMLARMFDGTALNHDMGGMNLRLAGVNLNRIFRNCGMSTENYSRTLIGFANYVHANGGLPANVDMLSQNGRTYNNTNYVTGQQFNNAVDARDYLINTAGWSIGSDTQV